jgi:hypothetical protein
MPAGTPAARGRTGPGAVPRPAAQKRLERIPSPQELARPIDATFVTKARNGGCA